MTEIIHNLFPFLITGLLGIFSHLYLKLDKRIEMLERSLPEKVNETQVRLLMQDKIYPICEDLKEIKDKIDKITDHLLQSK